MRLRDLSATRPEAGHNMTLEQSSPVVSVRKGRWAGSAIKRISGSPVEIWRHMRAISNTNESAGLGGIVRAQGRGAGTLLGRAGGTRGRIVLA
jgi:hypothetical protein